MKSISITNYDLFVDNIWRTWFKEKEHGYISSITLKYYTNSFALLRIYLRKEPSLTVWLRLLILDPLFFLNFNLLTNGFKKPIDFKWKKLSNM